jgi:3-dehydroshikimate dehydratase
MFSCLAKISRKERGYLMKLSICTISFRHHLYSIDQLAHFAQQEGFEGIELWGVHAKNLAADSHYGEEWLNSYDLKISMLSDYLPLEQSISHIKAETDAVSLLAKRWGTNKIRTFVGKKGSVHISKEERIDLAYKLRMICDILAARGQFLLVETHSNTLTDNVASTLQLLEEVNHPALRVNFDVLHIWESGANPITAIKQLRPFVSHFHLKNISSHEKLNVFSPDNVYAASGSREGMVPLFEGAVNYEDFLSEIVQTMEIEASLEWFGHDAKHILAKDRREIVRLIENKVLV